MISDFEGKVAVVTGGASGIGLALAQRCVREGMRVAIADVEQGALDAASKQLEDAGGQVLARRCDVSSAEQMDALRDAVLDRFGAVHLVCNNAGVVTRGASWEQTLDDWEWVLGVDLWGVIHGVRAFVPVLRAQGEPGHVVNTASMAGLTPFARIAPYNVAKTGVVALSETLHHELAAEGSPVGVSVLCPGVVATRIGSSERNRPGAAEPPAERVWASGMPPTTLDPADVAQQVIDAVRSDRFWIVTHPQYQEVIAARAATIASGEAPAAPPVW